MTSRFRLENQSPLTLSAFEVATNADSGDHVHGATETFYVLEGELEHIVNGRSVKLTAG